MSNNFELISPVDNTVILTREYASDSQINDVLGKAQGAQYSWSQTSIEERALICRKALNFFEDNKDTIALEIAQQMGRPIRYCAGEIAGLQERGEHMIDIAAKCLADIEIENSIEAKRFIRRNPVGTVLVLAPWNYPFLTAVNTIVPALMAGNSVVLKHSAQTPLSAERFVQAFQESGLPEGVFQYLHLSHSQVERIVRSPQIDFVAFTGSVSGGKAIEQAASGRFIGVGLELGGKDPAYVCADADIELTAEGLVDGAFFNSGQSCCGIERIYVEKNVYDKFVEAFVELTKDYVLGNPLENSTTMGPVVSMNAASYIKKQIDQALAQGAKACIAESRYQEITNALGANYLGPQVLTKVDHTMDVMREETFGPVVGIMPVADDKEALQLMNDSQYGLTASIWSQDAVRAEQLGDQIQTGTVFLNRCDYLDPALVWTGVKNTGRGGTLSQLGYHALTQAKSFHLRR